MSELKVSDSESSHQFEPFWEWPLSEVDDLQFGLLLRWTKSADEIDEDFYPNEPPTAVRSRVAELSDELLISYGDDDSPYFEWVGILWDKSRNSGRLYQKNCDQTIASHIIENLDSETILPLIWEILTGYSNPILLQGSASENSEANEWLLQAGFPDLDSLVWNPVGFEIYDDRLVPRSEVERLIRLIYKTLPGGWIRTEYPSPESWLQRVYGDHVADIAATVTVEWGYESHVLQITHEDWEEIKSGDQVTIEGQGYTYEGVDFVDYWQFDGGIGCELRVTYVCDADEGEGEGYIGPLTEDMIKLNAG